MTARLRLQEFLARAGDRVNQGTRQGVGDAIGGLDRLGAEQRRQEQKQLLAAKLTAAGIMGGTNPAAPRTVDRPGTVKMTRPETLEEKAARFFKTVGKDMPSVQRDLGEGGVRGLLAQPIGSQVDAARVRNIDAGTAVKGAQLATEGERTKKVTADTAGKVQDTAVKGLKEAVGAIESDMGRVDTNVEPDAIEDLIRIHTEMQTASFPNAKPEVVRGMVAAAVYKGAKDRAEFAFQRKKIATAEALAQAKFEAAREDAKTRTLTTQEVGILTDRKAAVTNLAELDALSRHPEVRAQWKNFNAGAAKMAELTGQFSKQLVNLEQWEAGMRGLDIDLEGKTKSAEFLRRMRSDLFTIARSKNGPGVMTDADLNFWLPVLLNPAMTPVRFDNAMSRLRETTARDYKIAISVFSDIARGGRVPGEFWKDRNIDVKGSVVTGGIDKPESTMGNVRSVGQAVSSVSNAIDEFDVLNPGKSVNALLSGESGKTAAGERSGGFDMRELGLGGIQSLPAAEEAEQAAREDLKVTIARFGQDSEEALTAAQKFGAATNLRKQAEEGGFKSANRRGLDDVTGREHATVEKPRSIAHGRQILNAATADRARQRNMLRDNDPRGSPENLRTAIANERAAQAQLDALMKIKGRDGLGNIAGPSASTLGPRVDALRKKIQGN